MDRFFNRIATIITVHNRKQKTLSCLNHLYLALDAYNTQEAKTITLAVFLTDDGCTDGTAEAIKEHFPDRDIHILQGSGDLFWAGGMRVAWQAAIDHGNDWDFFLLLNDDTTVYDNVFDELFEADAYGFKEKGVHGLSSGITCAPGDKATITYGGLNFTSWTKGPQKLVIPNGQPQAIDLVHANILLVHQSVVSAIGIFFKGYQHSCADNDYGLQAQRRHLPVYSTAHVCGECERDHQSNKGEAERLMQMTRAERKKYINAPTHSDSDYLLYVRRNIKWRYPMTCIVRFLRLNTPKLYYWLTNLRGGYQS